MGNVLQSNSLTIVCLNGPSVQLHVRYELVASGLMPRSRRGRTAAPVSTIVFHRVSGD